MRTIAKPHLSLSSNLSHRHRIPISSLSFFYLPPCKLSLAIRASSNPNHPRRPPVINMDNNDVVTGVDDVIIKVGNNDMTELKGKMESNIKEGKVKEALAILERLIGLEPDDVERPLMRAHLYCYNGNFEMARLGFDEILNKDPTRFDAIHGLLIAAASEGASLEQIGKQTKDIPRKIGEAMEICKRENRNDDYFSDYLLVSAQIFWVIFGDYDKALEASQELVKKKPEDFRPYLCQGILYTLLKETDEAERQLEMYRTLVPKGHPCALYFDELMIVANVIDQKVVNEQKLHYPPRPHPSEMKTVFYCLCGCDARKESSKGAT